MCLETLYTLQWHTSLHSFFPYIRPNEVTGLMYINREHNFQCESTEIYTCKHRDITALQNEDRVSLSTTNKSINQ